MDRKSLKLPFNLDKKPIWTCPTCEKGVLNPTKESFKSDELGHSRDHSHDSWEPDCIEYVYSCQLTCSNGACSEVVSSAGTGGVDVYECQNEDGYWEQSYESIFKPTFFQPHLKLFRIPPECPPEIVEPLNESFKLFFSSPSAASNSVRMAIEALLTALKVKRFNLIKGQRRIISLHQRIQLLPTKYSELKDMLTAIKWLGNAGSHSLNGITQDDVLDAYDFTEHVLAEIYSPQGKKLAALAKRVNKKRGPTK